MAALRLAILELYANENEDADESSFQTRLNDEGRARRQRKVPRVALQRPNMSAFCTLFGSGCDQSLLTLCGFDHHAFRELLSLFEPIYISYSPYSTNGCIRRVNPTITGGRPRSMSATQCLALTLAWTRSKGSEGLLSIIFGVTGSVCSLFIRFGRRILIRRLRNDSRAAVKMPTTEQIREFQDAFRAKHPSLKDVYCVADGLKLRLEQCGDVVIQNRFYNGWTHDHYVSNVLVFAPHGRIIACALNAPGSFHDSTVASYGDIYERLESVFNNTGGKCVVDSAFCRTRYPFLIKSGVQSSISTFTAEDVLIESQATSARQSAEWGMRALQSSFPRLKDRLIFEVRGERRLILVSSVLLFNFRTSVVGLNQLLHVYMPHLSPEANSLFPNLSF